MNRFLLLTLILYLAGGVGAVSAQTGWEVQNSGTANNLNTVFFLNADTGFAAGASGIVLKTTDGGTTWIDISPIYAPDLNGIYFFTADSGLVVGSNGTILRTANGGTTWLTVTSGIADAIMTVSFSGGNGICGALSQSIIYSHDAGVTWSVAQSGFMGGGFRGSVMLSPDIGFVGGENSIFQPMVGKTTNGGQNWTFFIFYLNNNEGRINGLEFTDVNTGYAACRLWNGEGAISKTTNGGSTWSITLFSSSLNGVDFPVSNASLIGYVVGNGGIILKTEDAGTSWQNLNSGTSVNLTDVFFVNPDTGYVVGQGGTILKTTTGGEPPNSIGASTDPTLPRANRLLPNYPNPFNPVTQIGFQISDPGFVELKIYNVLGQEVAVLVNKNLSPGTYRVNWDAGNFPGGVYFCRLAVTPAHGKAGQFSEVRKMLLIR